MSRRRGNPATRGQTWPFRVQLLAVSARHPAGRWGDVKGCATREEAVEYVCAQTAGSLRVRHGRRTVFALTIYINDVDLTIKG